MGFNFNFFGETEHRVFNYKPRYYDPEKEERRRIFGKVDGSLDKAQPGKTQPGNAQPGKDGENTDTQAYTPGKYISGSFRDGNYQHTRRDTGRIHKIIGMVGLILMFVVLWYIARFYGIIIDQIAK